MMHLGALAKAAAPGRALSEGQIYVASDAKAFSRKAIAPTLLPPL